MRPLSIFMEQSVVQGAEKTSGFFRFDMKMTENSVKSRCVRNVMLLKVTNYIMIQATATLATAEITGGTNT